MVVPPVILVDDPGHADDICLHVKSAMTYAGRPHPENLRVWLAKEFFPLHIKDVLEEPSQGADLLAARDAFGELLGLALHPRLQQGHALPRPERLRRAEARARGAPPRVADERAARRAPPPRSARSWPRRRAFVEELRAFLEEVKRVAPLWNPNLDDGVIINFAPLWRLVPQNKPGRRS